MKKPRVTFTHPEKVFFPATGFTKGDLVKYYLDVAPWLLPHLRGRPVTLVRFPDGVAGIRFFEKRAPSFTPAWVRTVRVARRSTTGTIDYVVIDDVDTLAWCANLAAIELHPFLHRRPRLERPTHLVFDLDPGEGADLLTCVGVARRVKEVLDRLGLESFPKVSGSKGLQVYVPLNTPVTYPATGAFARAVAELLERRHPDLVVSQMRKELRRGKVLIDWSQNARAKTTVAPYSVRGKRAEPYVSLPVTWRELAQAERRGGAEALFFSPAEALRRVRRRGDLFAPVLTLRQRLPADFLRLEPKKADSLAAYRAKRDFAATAEPAPRRRPERTRPKAGGNARFVIQKHAASHLHYDFRLERDGALKSWAIPKGVPTEPGVRHAAFRVEDHPLEYLRFEGTIPAGQYGGGTVMVWDIGTYTLLGGDVEAGRLKLRLHGRKLKGEWHLFRIQTEKGKEVWLIAKSGAAARPVSARQEDRSALTGRSMAQIARAPGRQWRSPR